MIFLLQNTPVIDAKLRLEICKFKVSCDPSCAKIYYARPKHPDHVFIKDFAVKTDWKYYLMWVFDQRPIINKIILDIFR